MTLEQYNNIKPGMRIICELNGRLRVARVKCIEQQTLICQLKRFMMDGWCSSAVRVTRSEVIEVTYGQQHIGEMIGGAK